MQQFSNPLDNIKIASPCAADWNEMLGDERRRYCSTCKLNVYNLSEMTREEAENFLVRSEGRVCLRVHRRRDGTVLTQNCPVGWALVKRKVSRAASAFFALAAGFGGGIFAFESGKPLPAPTDFEFSAPAAEPEGEQISFGGMIENLPQIKFKILQNR